MTVIGATVSMRRGTNFMRNTPFTGTALRTLTTTGKTWPVSSNRLQSGSAKSTRQGASDLFAVAPNLTSVTVREGAVQMARKQESWAGVVLGSPTADKLRHLSTQVFGMPVLQALTASSCSQLTDLTVDSATISGQALTSVLRAHSGTLAYVCLRGITMTSGTVSEVLQLIGSDISLSRLVVDSLIAGGQGYKIAPVWVRRTHFQRTPWRTVEAGDVNEDGEEQSWVAGE